MAERWRAPPLISFSAEGWQDYVYWSQNDRRMLKRINELIDATLRDPFHGSESLNRYGLR